MTIPLEATQLLLDDDTGANPKHSGRVRLRTGRHVVFAPVVGRVRLPEGAAGRSIITQERLTSRILDGATVISDAVLDDVRGGDIYMNPFRIGRTNNRLALTT